MFLSISSVRSRKLFSLLQQYLSVPLQKSTVLNKCLGENVQTSKNVIQGFISWARHQSGYVGNCPKLKSLIWNNSLRTSSAQVLSCRREYHRSVNSYTPNLSRRILLPLSSCTHTSVLATVPFHSIINGRKSQSHQVHGLSFPLFHSGKSLFNKLDRLQDASLSKRAFSPAKSILDSSPPAWQPYLKLIRFDKPIGTWLLYWPCTWSIALAAQPGCLPDFKLLALFGMGAFFMRGAGCIINDMWDKDFDSKVSRTMQRPLAAGEVTYFQALVFLASQLSISLTILLQLNWYSVCLGASSMALVITYPLFKRFTYWPQIMLGLAFNYGTLLGWAAVHGSVDWAVCLPLYMSCILWTLVYDTIYAHQDKYDDMLIGVKSTALRLGDKTKPWLTGFTVCMTAGLVECGLLCDMPWPYYLGVGLTGTRLLQQILFTNLDDADQCAKAFKDNFYLGVVMFTVIVIANLMKSKQEEEKDAEHEGKGGMQSQQIL